MIKEIEERKAAYTDIVAESIKKPLTEHGFKGSGRHFIKQMGEFSICFLVADPSRIYEEIIINYGFYVPYLIENFFEKPVVKKPKVPDCYLMGTIHDIVRATLGIEGGALYFLNKKFHESRISTHKEVNKRIKEGYYPETEQSQYRIDERSVQFLTRYQPGDMVGLKSIVFDDMTNIYLPFFDRIQDIPSLISALKNVAINDGYDLHIAILTYAYVDKAKGERLIADFYERTDNEHKRNRLKKFIQKMGLNIRNL